MRAIVLVLVLAGASLAGCLGGADAPSATRGEPLETALVPAAPGASGAADEAQAPTWALGDAWSVVTSGPSGEERVQLVVTGVSSDAYTVSTTGEQMAMYEALFDISYLGRIRASDLAGHQQDQPVRYFDFPLADNKTWSTTWDGLEVVLKATRGARGFDIVGTVEGEPYVAYDFVPELKWFSRLRFEAQDFTITVERLDEGWTGTLAVATAKTVYEASTTTPVATSGSGAFTIDEGQTHGVVVLAGGGERWARAFALVDPSGQQHPTTQISNFDSELMGPRHAWQLETFPATAGEWHVLLEGAHDPEGRLSLAIHQVAITPAPFGA